MISFKAIWAVMKHSITRFTLNPIGYVVISVFVVATGFGAFGKDQFFAANIADLSELNRWMPWFLVVFIPALTMTFWADERRSGTMELLLTLPVRDVEVTLGKYFGAVGVYAVSLLFALADAVVLARLGHPDIGLLAANYLGYLLLGAALIPLGLIASSITNNATVAFILGTVFCAAGLGAERGAAWALGPASRLVKGTGVLTHFESFALGDIALADVLFFVVLAAALLYINIVLIGKRHWSAGKDGPEMGWHQLARSIAVVAIAASVSILAGRYLMPARIDATSEGINSSSPEMVTLLKGDRAANKASILGAQPVYIRAYMSPDVPEEYVTIRETLRRTLRAIQSQAGDSVIVQMNESVEPFSDAARDAEDQYNIRPRTVREAIEGRHKAREIFLGVAITCGPRQEVIPFFDKGLSVEYELARAIRSAAKAEKRKVGILKTEAQVMGGMDPRAQMMGGMPQQTPRWAIVEELSKQYEVVDVDPENPIGGDFDVLLAVQPTGLQPQAMANFEDYVLSGKPVLMFLDPLPMELSRGPFPMPSRPQNDLGHLLGRMGARWDKDNIVCDASVRFERLPDLPESIVFISRSANGFSDKDPVTKDLSRMVLLFGGQIKPLGDATTKFTPLLQTGRGAGLVSADDAMPLLMGRGSIPFLPGGESLTMAARISGSAGKHTPGATTQPVEARVNAIVVADLDMISGQFFDMRAQGDKDLKFDNITFVLNCVDSLAGDADLVALRSRQPKYRTLETIESQRRVYREQMARQKKEAEDKAKKELEEAQKRFDGAIAEIDKRTDLDDRTKDMMKEQVRQYEQKRLDARKTEIESSKQNAIRRASLESDREVSGIENRARIFAIILPTLLPLAIGSVVLLGEQIRERRSVPLARSMRK